MKKVLAIVAGLAFALALTVNAADSTEKHRPTDEQKALRKEMLAKYDTNKDGKLDKEERAKMTKEDKDKWEAAFGHKKGDSKSDSKEKKN